MGSAELTGQTTLALAVLREDDAIRPYAEQDLVQTPSHSHAKMALRPSDYHIIADRMRLALCQVISNAGQDLDV